MDKSRKRSKLSLRLNILGSLSVPQHHKRCIFDTWFACGNHYQKNKTEKRLKVGQSFWGGRKLLRHTMTNIF